MLCYKDMTFCSSDCINTDCYRNFTPDDRNKVIALDLPVAWADYSKDCPDYTPPTAEKETTPC